MTSHSAAVEFPVPPDMRGGFWQWDKMHAPRPLTPLSQDFMFDNVSSGFTAGMDELGCPLGFAMKTVNYYRYAAMYPLDPPGQDNPARRARYARTMSEVLPRMGELWEKEWLPSILPALKKARETNYASLSDSQLLATLEEQRKDVHNRYTVHGKINFVTISASMFADFYNEVFSPEDPTEPYAILQGFPTRSLDAGRGLWRLSRKIKQGAALRQVFEKSEPSQITAQLEKTPEGKEFLKDFRAYLDEFGWRSDAFDLSDATWREDPRIPLNTLQGYLRLGDEGDPEVRYQESIKVRERLLAAARSKLGKDPVRLARFNQLYEMARHYLPITENHNFYIDQIGNAVVRLPVTEAGRRLAGKGLLNGPDDIFMLHMNEVGECFNGKDQRSLASKRRAEIEKWSKVIPVPVIGEPPPHHDGPPDPLVGAFMKMFGLPVEPSRDPSVITGIGASAGVARGRARIVRSLAEGSKLQKGDIMVCEMTMPPWTPLFSTVSAVVADTGGVLSHCAIVSREYRMPCVVGTRVGTAVIKDGMMLTVDGSKGIVRIDARS